jgi:penicillin-binding protein 2
MGVTPLQLARYAAILANGGVAVAPHFARHLRHPETGHLIRAGVPRPRRLPIAPEHMAVVRRAMLMVVEQGTGRRSRIEGIAMAGKTGTAENPHGDDHALFIGFAPFDDPTIAVAVMVENAGFGSQTAAPIASLMIERYLTGGIAESRRPLMEGLLRPPAPE